MAQFDVYRNADPASKSRIPLLLDVQADLLDGLATRIVIPLCRPEFVGRKPVERLNPELEFEGRKLVLLTQELAGVPRKALGQRVGNLSGERREIIAALDFAITGF